MNDAGHERHDATDHLVDTERGGVDIGRVGRHVERRDTARAVGVIARFERRGNPPHVAADNTCAVRRIM